MFISPYTTGWPALPPPVSGSSAPNPTAGTINAATGTAPDGANNSPPTYAPYAVELPAGEGINVEVVLSAGTASYWPAYWTPLAGDPGGNGGRWVALGYDAAAGGAGACSANVANSGGTANARYGQMPEGRRWWCLVRTATGAETLVYARIEPRKVIIEG